MSERLTLALLGCGQATRTHSKTLARVAPDVRRVYASRDLGRAQSFNAEYGGDGAFGSYEAAIAATDVDAVVIATPPASHLALSLAAAEAGKHVVVEKPAYFDTPSFDRAFEALQAADRLLLVAENYFYRPLLERVRAVVQSGDLGRVLFVHVNALKQQETGGWRDEPGLAGGGALLEGGIHWVDFVANLGLELRAVHGLSPDAGQTLERSMLLALEYAEGAVGSLSYSWAVHSPLKGIRISRVYGTAGSLTFESNGICLLQTGRRFRLRLLPGLSDIAGFKPMWRDFVAALRAGRPAKHTPELARRDLELIEQAYTTAGLTSR